VVGQRAGGVRVALSNDALPALNREAERLQQGLQHGVGLKAVAATAAVEDALDQPSGVQWRRLAKLHREIFVWNAGDERPVHGSQPGRVGDRRVGDADAPQETRVAASSIPAASQIRDAGLEHPATRLRRYARLT